MATKRATSAVSASAREPFIPTADAVSALRQRLAMNKSEFAGLIGVSPPTIGNWEKRKGLLNPHPKVLEALQKLAIGAAKGTRRTR